MADRSNEAVAKFSGGMKRRLNIAIGLVHNPKVILLDEPTVGIDPQSRNAILELIREIARSGTTILFTTHHLEEAQALCERIAIMDHGKILECGTLDELITVVGGEELVTVQGNFTSSQFHSLIQSQPVTPISITDSKATLALQNQQFKLSSLIQLLSEGEIDIDDLSIQKPNLESVFLKLTGRELRD